MKLETIKLDDFFFSISFFIWLRCCFDLFFFVFFSSPMSSKYLQKIYKFSISFLILFEEKVTQNKKFWL